MLSQRHLAGRRLGPNRYSADSTKATTRNRNVHLKIERDPATRWLIWSCAIIGVITTIAAVLRRARTIKAAVKKQRGDIKSNKATLLYLIVDDVERVKQCLHSGISAPQRKQ